MFLQLLTISDLHPSLCTPVRGAARLVGAGQAGAQGPGRRRKPPDTQAIGFKPRCRAAPRLVGAGQAGAQGPGRRRKPPDTQALGFKPRCKQAARLVGAGQAGAQPPGRRRWARGELARAAAARRAR